LGELRKHAGRLCSTLLESPIEVLLPSAQRNPRCYPDSPIPFAEYASSGYKTLVGTQKRPNLT